METTISPKTEESISSKGPPQIELDIDGQPVPQYDENALPRVIQLSETESYLDSPKLGRLLIRTTEIASLLLE